MNDLQKRKAELGHKMRQLTDKKEAMTPAERTTLNACMAEMATIRADEERMEKAEALRKELDLPTEVADEQRSAARHEGAFRRYITSGDDAELRTYSALSTSGLPIPEGFAAKYVEALKSFSGLRQVANVITTSTGDPLKNPFSNDTANNGVRLAENATVPLANPTLSSTEFGAFRYCSQGLQYSVSLQEDSGIAVETYLASIFAKRIGRITNSEFTNGASGGPVGVIPSLTQIVPSATPTAVGIADIVALQALDEAYLAGAVYHMHPAILRTLRAMVGTDGLPEFPELRTGNTLCGYQVTFNVDLPSSLTAGAKAILFGNFQHAVTIREVVPSVLVSKERFAEYRQMYASMRHDQDCQVVDASAVNVLQQHS